MSLGVPPDPPPPLLVPVESAETVREVGAVDVELWQAPKEKAQTINVTLRHSCEFRIFAEMNAVLK